MGKKKKSEKLSFDSEASILEYDFDPEEIFTAPGVSQVPEEVLNFFSFTDQDRAWARAYVSQQLQGRWVSWDNKEAVLRYLLESPERTAEKYFDHRFPLYNRMVFKFSIIGYNPGFMRRAFLGEEPVQGHYTQAFTHKRRDFKDQLIDILEAESKEQLDALVHKAYGLTPEDWKESVGNRWQPLGPRPIIPPAGLTPKEAETYVSQLLRFYGLAGAKITRYSRDGGVDVESVNGVFQVKHQKAPVGVGVIREILGVAASQAKRAGVFAKVGFTKEATEFAEKNGILLFSYTPTFKGRTKAAEAFINSGFEAF
jgi:hypothetical protein